MKSRRRRTVIGGQFFWRLVEMLESPVMRVLNQSEHRVLMRLEIEMAHHGGTRNGALVVTHKQFIDYGVDREAVSPSIRCLEALRILEITKQGRGGNREYREASQYRLTYQPTDKANATNEWRSITTIGEARRLAVGARRAKDVDAVARSVRAAKRHKEAPENQETASDSPQVSGRNLRPETEIRQVGISDVVARVGISDVLSISRDGTRQSPREARPLGSAVASEATGHGEPIRLDILHNRLAQKLGWDVVGSMSDLELDAAAALEQAGALDGTAAVQIKLRKKLAGAGGGS
ncbi:hypothetical protein Q2941_43480 [Bradyrhizobium sp. UFLA05-153]